MENKISKAPGFRLGNVIVMAGVPSIMQSMLDAVAPTLKTGSKMLVRTIEAQALPEGQYAAELGEIARLHAGVSIGSYPSFKEGIGFRNQIVARAKDEASLHAAASAIEALIAKLSADSAAV